ncbi:MAG: hypothetical protein ACFFE2_12580 [Candidatus Thorarchaeota archaeon]
MKESQTEGQKKRRRKFLGSVAVGIGLSFIAFVIVFGMLIPLVSADGSSVELVQIHNVIAGPILIFGILLILAGLIAILLPEGFSKDGFWSFQTGPYQ